ncbi:MAG: class I SAM-dependent methyltransferase [Planctomycetota bacterium]|nr:class I SAM-dependent methyltransferase [Planctomycetota bacterium]
MSESRNRARTLAQESIDQGDFRSWFEKLYATSEGDAGQVPWADLIPNPHLVSWFSDKALDKTGRALVIACGLGDDAELLADLGFEVTAFDISPTCIEWCKKRYPDSKVDYQAADLFAKPASWEQAFDFIFEANTLQVLPESEQPEALRQIASCLAPEGDLLLCARLRDADDHRGELPWPLREKDFQILVDAGLRKENWEDFFDNEDPPVRRVRTLYKR